MGTLSRYRKLINLEQLSHSLCRLYRMAASCHSVHLCLLADQRKQQLRSEQSKRNIGRSWIVPFNHPRTTIAHPGRSATSFRVSCPLQTATRTGLCTPYSPTVPPLSYSIARSARRTACDKFLRVRG